MSASAEDKAIRTRAYGAVPDARLFVSFVCLKGSEGEERKGKKKRRGEGRGRKEMKRGKKGGEEK